MSSCVNGFLNFSFKMNGLRSCQWYFIYVCGKRLEKKGFLFFPGFSLFLGSSTDSKISHSRALSEVYSSLKTSRVEFF